MNGNNLISLRLRRLDISFLLSLIDWNEQRDEHLGSKDRWEVKRKHLKNKLKKVLGEEDENC